MQIDKLYIKNFRGFEEKSFNLNPAFTVAIGDNGTGKSTLLQAVQVVAGAFFLGLPYINRRHIDDDEVRFSINKKSKQSEYFTPTIVEATGHINGSGEFTWRREITEHGKATSEKLSDIGQIKAIAETYAKSLNGKSRPMLPVIAFFGVKQLGGKPSTRKRTKKNRVIIKDGYYNALGSRTDEATFTQWFYYYKENLKADLEFKGTYEAVINAIETAIPYLKDVSFDNFRLELVADCEIEGQPTKRLPHSLMSDGVKRMLGIVTDIAYRCIVLNGFKGKDAVKETRGVIMIDELDMHLHPNWQRVVVQNLKNAFPNIQFVVTTHSPFIVQSLKAEELLIIDDDIKKDGDPFKKSIEEVAANEMGVEDIPRSVEFLEMQQVAEKYFTLIQKGKTSETSKTALALRTRLNKLEERFADDPAFVAALKIERNAKGL